MNQRAAAHRRGKQERHFRLGKHQRRALIGCSTHASTTNHAQNERAHRFKERQVFRRDGHRTAFPKIPGIKGEPEEIEVKIKSTHNGASEV